MKKVILLVFLLSGWLNAQVGIGTTDPQAMLDVNGNVRIQQIDEDLGNSKILVLGDNNEIKQSRAASFYALSGFRIPICQNNDEGDDGSFPITANGTTYTVSWEILVKNEGSGYSNRTVVTSASGGLFGIDTDTETLEIPNYPIQAQRLQVRYEFTPHLPFDPDGFNLTAYNNSNYPDTFSLNYTAADETGITVNITRTDHTSADQNENCWGGQFYFDMMMYNY